MKVNVKDILFISVLCFSQVESSGLMLVFSVFSVFIFFVNSRFLYKINISNYIYIIFLISLVMGGGEIALNLDVNFYDFMKDFFYFVQAPIYIYIGYCWSLETKYNYIHIVKVITISITLITIFNFIEIPFHLDSLSSLGMNSRYEFKFHNPYALISLMILFLSKYQGVYLFSKCTDRFLMILSLLSIMISFSRTDYLSAIFVFLLPLFLVFNIERFVVMFFLLIITIGIFGSNFIDVNPSRLESVTLSDKLNHSLSEIVIRKMDDQAEISDNWRGYEAYMGLERYYDGNILQLMFGRGFGSNVKTPYWIFNGEYLNVVPIFHNGYITVLLKSGIFGFLIFLLFIKGIVFSYRENLGDSKLHNVAASYNVGLAFIVMLSTLVTHGIFTKNPPFISLFLLGAGVCFLTNKEIDLK